MLWLMLCFILKRLRLGDSTVISQGSRYSINIMILVMCYNRETLILLQVSSVDARVRILSPFGHYLGYRMPDGGPCPLNFFPRKSRY